MSVFMFFGLIWTLKFIDDEIKFICMSSAASYYFDCTNGYEGEANVSQAFYFAYAKHLGSFAFGSFCITFVNILTFLADSLDSDGENGA